MASAPHSRKIHSVFFTIFFSLLLVLVIEIDPAHRHNYRRASAVAAG